MLTVLYLLIVHNIADFRLQTNWMAINKSKRMDALLKHVAIYSVAMGIATWSIWFALITFVCHLATDWVTSRMARRQYWYVQCQNGLWLDAEGVMNPNKFLGREWKRSRHAFFCTLGDDQLPHAAQLILTAQWLLN